MLLTESWVDNSNTELIKTSPNNYSFEDCTNSNMMVGGIAVIYIKNIFKCKPFSFNNYLNFEYLSLVIH